MRQILPVPSLQFSSDYLHNRKRNTMDKSSCRWKISYSSTSGITFYYDGVHKSFQTGCLEWEVQMVSFLPLGAIVSLFCESVKWILPP